MFNYINTQYSLVCKIYRKSYLLYNTMPSCCWRRGENTMVLEITLIFSKCWTLSSEQNQNVSIQFHVLTIFPPCYYSNYLLRKENIIDLDKHIDLSHSFKISHKHASRSPSKSFWNRITAIFKKKCFKIYINNLGENNCFTNNNNMCYPKKKWFDILNALKS